MGEIAKYTLEIYNIVKDKNFNLFDFDYDFYSDDIKIKHKFEQQFIDNYMFYEIGFETVFRFKHALKTKLNNIMTIYKQLYESQLRCQDIDFMLNKDLREEFERSIEGNVSSISTLNSSDNQITMNKESNIENGNASLSLEKGSLTNVGENNLNIKSDSNNTNEGLTNQKEKTILISKGNIGITSSAELLEKWRKTFININLMIIEECEDLFMRIY